MSFVEPCVEYRVYHRFVDIMHLISFATADIVIVAVVVVVRPPRRLISLRTDRFCSSVYVIILLPSSLSSIRMLNLLPTAGQEHLFLASPGAGAVFRTRVASQVAVAFGVVSDEGMMRGQRGNDVSTRLLSSSHT